MESPDRKHNRAAEVGVVLGVVFVIMGFAYSVSAIWMLGFIFLAIGVYSKKKAG